MEPALLATGAAAASSLAAAAATGVTAWRMRSRALRAEASVARLNQELQAERHAATHDSLTGLPNRRAFYQLGVSLIARSPHPLVAVVLDLDNFKQINDRYGHAAGDQVLIAIAQRFAAYAGDDDLVARLGGDEFAGLLSVPSIDGGQLDRAARRLSEALAAPIQIVGRSVQVRASVGLAPTAGCHLAEALRHADAAMYRAKGAAAQRDRLLETSEEEQLCRPRRTALSSHP